MTRRGRRQVLVNGSKLSRSSDLRNYVRVVAFLPDDIDLVKRGPALRRELIDDVAVQLWPAAAANRREYERAVTQRNALLKSGRVDRFTLQVWNERVAQAGARLMQRRIAAASALMRQAPATYQTIAGEKTSIILEYVSTWGAEIGGYTRDELVELLAEALDETEAVDRERRQTTVGPHRDEPRFEVAGLSAREAASQGEQRTLALSLRLAEQRAIAELVGEQPILLLDDVFSELDADRSEALAQALPDTQTFVTTARVEDVPLPGKVWSVVHGEVR
jgi:DNA replication and repair protein RecF